MLKEIIPVEFPELEVRRRRHHTSYFWDRHMVIRLTRMVRNTVIEPDRYGFFTGEYVVVQVFPPLAHKRAVRRSGRVDVYWGVEPLCGYDDPEMWLRGVDEREFMNRPTLRGYLWFRFDEDGDEEYAVSLLGQVVSNARRCIRRRRLIQPSGERLTIREMLAPTGQAPVPPKRERPSPAPKKGPAVPAASASPAPQPRKARKKGRVARAGARTTRPSRPGSVAEGSGASKKRGGHPAPAPNDVERSEVPTPEDRPVKGKDR